MDMNLDNLICRSHRISSDDITALKSKWLTLEDSLTTPFFLTWPWIFNWLSINSSLSNQFLLVEAIKDNKTVGLALFRTKTIWVFPYIKLNQLWLHRHGEERADQIWIEHNDILAIPEHHQKIRQGIFQHVLSSESPWQEVYLGMSNEGLLNDIKLPGTLQRTLIDSPAFRANLSLHPNLSSYLSSLSKNTRAQISKSKKNLSAFGAFQLEMASELSEKQLFFKQITEKHIERWSENDFGSGFNNPVFVNFHQRLIFQDQENRYSRLYRLSQNGESLGLVYILTTKHTWYFYLSAITFHTDPKIKVGLLLHALIIEQAIKENVTIYDFMAGEAQYKKSLSNCPKYTQQLICCYRHTLLTMVREKLRTLKAWLMNLK